MTDLALCSVEGCKSPVQKPGHTLCLPHWKESRQTAKESAASYVVTPQPTTSHDTNNTTLTSTLLGEHFNLEAKHINRVLLDIGWIEKEGNGWKPSELGEKLKAQKQTYFKNGNSYIVWHKDICKSRILQNAISEFRSIEVELPPITKISSMPEEAADKTKGFRERFPPPIRASDGHMVRSRAEAMIDGFLYGNRIVHAYEPLVPVKQEMYCDFYLPECGIYIEYWGLESDPKYKAKKEKKLEIYRQNDLRLIEIKDEHIANLDDYLMGQLVKFGYKAN